MVRKYISAVFETWEGKMSGTASLVLTVIAAYSTYFSGIMGPWRLQTYFWVAAGFTFLYANYKAWSREHKKVISSMPNISLAIEQIRWEYASDKHNTVLILAVNLVNRGAPSITRSWYAVLEIGSSREALSPILISSAWVIRDGNQSATIYPKDQIIAKTMEKRLETGEGKVGRIFFTIPGNRTDQLKTAQFKVHVGFYDFMGKNVEQTFIPNPAPLVGVQIYPSEQGTYDITQLGSTSYTPLPQPEEDK
jgi:hypothetical protein